ncbi:glucokinase [Spirochaeta cellobiosiphila]|uniref:glucokinase n=1 Tax=Spirochaeta cellobiosiphila TaxID=504483 RepID=UPI0003FE0511|nr:glucokinase [Spirochaeta cellobiosiphila]
MKTNWYIHENHNWEHLIISGDAGGTNTNIAIVGKKATTFDIILECVFPSDDVTVFLDTITKTLEEFKLKFPELPISACCISAAGAVVDNICQMTNQDWAVDGKAIEDKLSIPTVLINDFMAISYSLPLLDINNPKQIEILAHPDGSYPEAHGNVRAVMGAGTGLGVGFSMEYNNQYIACPSEGGHSDFAPYDELTTRLHTYMINKYKEAPAYELLVSGQGLVNIFQFFVEEEEKGELSPEVKEIKNTPDRNKPPLIAQYAEKDALCLKIMNLFIDIYGHAAASLNAILLPSDGFYLAGGIISKNLKYFKENYQFMKSFEKNSAPHIREFLRDVPVYVIKEYSTSLYGAANAGYILLLQ